MKKITYSSLFLFLWLAVCTVATARDDIGGSFELLDYQGNLVDESHLKGQPTLLYFGFSSCGHICPADLSRMAQLNRKASLELQQKVRLVFVTLDPERDKGPHLKQYVKQFHPDFIGLTGTPSAISAIADKYHVYHKKVAISDTNYIIDHSTFLFLLDTNGRHLAHFGRKLPTDEIWASMKNLLEASVVSTKNG